MTKNIYKVWDLYLPIFFLQDGQECSTSLKESMQHGMQAQHQKLKAHIS